MKIRPRFQSRRFLAEIFKMNFKTFHIMKHPQAETAAVLAA